MAELSYKSAGVDYDSLDSFKRACQRAADATRGALSLHNLSEPRDVRGDSAYLLDAGDQFIAHVEEGLGTKNLIADAMAELTGRCYYHAMGVDTVATIVNDCVTSGALPFSVAMHAAVGDSGWFNDQDRSKALAEGFAEGCRQAGAVWGGGETPALKGIVQPGTIVLAGSAVGRIRPKSSRIVGNIAPGDAIILIASSGLQTNGLTLCRTLAERLPQGYRTLMDDGRMYGEAILDPSVVYVKLIAGMASAGIIPHYAAHITGHGWRKLMRAVEPMVYRISNLGGPMPEVFNFILKASGLSRREAYATFNMGAGFAIFVEPALADKVISIATGSGYRAWQAGTLEKQGDRKAVIIEPEELIFESDTLQVR